MESLDTVMTMFTKKTEEKNVMGTEKRLALQGEFANTVLVRPRITEKAYALNASNRYVFEVASKATKATVKKAVEAVYGVSVVSVNIVNLKGRVRRFGNRVGLKSAVKKAIVQVKDGESITLFKAGL